MADDAGGNICEKSRLIIEQLGKDRKVEELTHNIAKGDKTPEIDDLIQYIYEELLTYDCEKIVNLHDKNQLIFFVVRMINNNYNSTHSRFYYTYRKNKWLEIGQLNVKDEPTDTNNPGAGTRNH